MTSLSSGDRPAEETCTCGHGRLLHTVRGCGMCRCRRFRPATPPAVRTGDDAATVNKVAAYIDLRGGAGDDPELRAYIRPALPPVSGTATRDDVARWLFERTRTRGGDTWGWWSDDLTRAVDELLTLGGSQSAQPAEEQRPDDGLRRLVERIRDLAPSAVAAAEHDLGIIR